MWFAIVGKRTLQGTTARTRLPAENPSPRKTSTWSSPTLCACTSVARTAVVCVELDVSLVGDLATAGGIEGRLTELGEERAVAEILVGVQLRQHVALVVADERRRVGRAREVGCALGVGLAACARDRAVLRHALPVGVDIDRLAPLLGELDRELEREPVGGGERERIVARDRVLAGELLEDLETALERLPESLLLRLDDPLDLGLMLDDLGIPRARPDRRRSREGGRPLRDRSAGPARPRAG